MKPVKNETIIQQLNWRYATKRFDPLRKISEPDWKTLELALELSPSSYGLQPWRFFIVTDPKLRAELRPVSWNQPQIEEASHLVVFAIKRNLSVADVDRHIERIIEVRGVPRESVADYRGMMAGFVGKSGAEFDINDWAARQVYIALGVFLASAAMLGIDACPMEGFDSAKYDQILGLDKVGYHATVLAATGYRSANDQYAKYSKVRFPEDELIVHL